MKKVKLYYEMRKSDDVGSDSEDGSTIAIVTDNIAQRLLEGQKVGMVVCYLIALASLQGWNRCFLLKAEELKPLTPSELLLMEGKPVFDRRYDVYRVIDSVTDVDELCSEICFTDGYEADTEHDVYGFLEEAPL